MGKHQHIDTVQDKIDIMQHQVKIFKGSFVSLFKKCLASFWEEIGRLLSQVECKDLFVKCGLDHRKLEDMSQYLSGKIVIDKLEVDFEIVNTFIVVCSQLPAISYVDHVELRVLDKEMANLEFPTMDEWNIVQKLGRTNYKLDQ